MDLVLSPTIAAALPMLFVTGVSGIVLFVLRKLLLSALHRVATHTDTKIDDFLLTAFKAPSLVVCVALALYLGLQVQQVPAEVQAVADRGMAVLGILGATAIVANLLCGLVLNAMKRSLGDRPVAGIGVVLVKGVIWTLGALVVLNQVGLEITPLITALGVGGLAMALALQDTLSNLFAGIHILLERPFEVGHWIQGESWEGRVVDISWRTTRVHTLGGHYVVIPNSKIAGATIQNFNLPDPAIRAQVDLSVGYGSDLELVVHALTEEVSHVIATDDAFVKRGPPVVHVTGLGDNGVTIAIRVYVTDFSVLRRSMDLLYRRVYRRLRLESVEIPFPQRVVWLKHEEEG